MDQEDEDDQLERNMRLWAARRTYSSAQMNVATSATSDAGRAPEEPCAELEVSGTIEQTTLVKYGFQCDFEWEDDVRLRF